MAAAITFDTLQFVKTLTDAGVPVKQAEAQATAYKIAHENNLDDFVKKENLKEFELAANYYVS